jgi:hypothetical protein
MAQRSWTAGLGPDPDDPEQVERWLDQLEADPDQEEQEEEDDMPTTEEVQELAPLGRESTSEDYLDARRTEAERYNFVERFPETAGRIHSEMRAAARVEIEWPPEIDVEDVQPREALWGRGGAARQVHKLLREGEVTTASAQTIEALGQRISDLEGDRVPSAERVLRERELEALVRHVEHTIPRPASSPILRSERYDALAGAWIVTENGRETRMDEAELAELAERAEEQKRGHPFGRVGADGTVALRPEDVSELTASEWLALDEGVREGLMQGRPQTGVRPPKTDSTGR